MGGQHFNRQAERIIGILKKQILRSFIGKKYTHEETCTILQEAVQVVNSRPLTAGLWAEKEPFRGPDAGQDQGRDTDTRFKTGQQLIKGSRSSKRPKKSFGIGGSKRYFCPS
jgi:hypothetical protein